MNNDNDLFINNNNSQNDDMVLVLLALFIPWKHLFKYFTKLEAIKSIIMSFCWNIYCKDCPI